MGTIDTAAARELERLQVAFEATGDGLWDLDLATGKLWLSPQLRQLIGGEAVGLVMEQERIFERIHPDDLAAVQAAAQPVLSGAESRFGLDVRLWHLGGHWTWMTIRGTVLAHSPEGMPTRMVGTLKDINSRKQIEIQNAVLLKLSDTLLRQGGADSTLQSALELLGRHLGVARVCFGDVDATEGTIRVRHEWSDGSVPSVIGTWRMPDFGRAKETQIRSGETVAVDDITQDVRTNDPHTLASYAPYAVRAVLNMPMIRNGQFEAVLFLHHPEPRRWTKADIQLAELARSRIWDAVIREQAEARLRESESRFASIFELTPTIPWVVDPGGQPVMLGASYTDKTGLGAEEVANDGWAETVHPDDRDEAVRTIVGCRKTGEIMDIRYRMRQADGGYRWVRVQGAPRRDAAGRITQWVGYIADIHEQVEAEIALRRSEAEARATAILLDQIMKTTLDPIWAVDLDGYFRMVNTAAAGVMGRTIADTVGKHMSEVLPAEAIETSMAQLQQVGQGEVVQREDWRYHHEKQAMRLFEHSKVPLRDADGRITGAVGIARDITERKQFEEALRSSEAEARATAALLDQVLETTPDAIWAMDLDRRYLMANSATSRIVGAAREEVIGRPVWDFLPTEFQRATKGQAEAIVGGADLIVEEPLFHKDLGEVRIFESRKVPLKGADGEVLGVVGISRDITERKQAEKALKASEEAARTAANLLERVLETTPALVWGLDRDGRYLLINSAAARILGSDRQTAVGRPIEELLSPDFAPKVRAELEQVLAGAEISVEESLFDAERGEMRLFDSLKVPLRNADGEVTGLVGVARDITERKSVELRLQAIVDNAVDSIVVIDEKGCIASANPATFTLFGHSEAEMVGRNVAMLMPPSEADTHDRYIDRYRTTGQRRIIGVGRQVMGLRKNGTTFPLDLSIAEWFDTDGRRHFTGIMRDVTAQLEAEGKLRRAHDTLLSVSRLSAAGAMASTLAHELNQPLTASSNLLRSARRLLERGQDGDKVPGLLAEASAEVLRAGSIIRRMREYTVNGELDPAPHRLADLAQTALTMVQRRAETRAVDIEWQLDPAVDKVMADPVQIEQVIANLLRNAVEAMDGSRERRIVIETEAEGDQAALHVHDSGHGIAPEQMDRLFQPFATTKDSGTGLGLAICRTIVEAHGGQIHANNRLGGRGATFTITLPVARTARHRAAKARA